jgi:hypothetical protein
MLARLFKSQRLNAELSNLKIGVNEVNNTATYIIKGAAINRKDYWEIKVASEKQKIALSAQTGSTLVFTFVMMATSETRMIIISTNTSTTAPSLQLTVVFRITFSTVFLEYMLWLICLRL